ncbi:MAG TPA: hypothetical protein VK614_04955 [Allosphingosinicella sp.]|nr:hypothetical protein [Allosphingosinicella sp.]
MLRLAKSSVCALAATMLYALPAHAQATRTWVSGVGDDVNPCSRTAPCKTFAGAISKTAAGGEINCLDPAGFGAVTITKSITIDCTGTLGGILASSTTGVLVNGAGAIVVLRALEINGGPPNLPGVNGIRFLQGASLTVEDSTIYNFLAASPNGHGILVNPTSGSLRLVVTNTVINNNGQAASGGGINIVPTGSASVQAVIRNVQLVGNPNFGIRVDGTNNTSGGLFAMIEGTTITGTGTGITAIDGAAGAPVNIMVSTSTLANNTVTGLLASGSNAHIRIGGSTITNSVIAATQSAGGVINTYGNNQVTGNSSDGTFTQPPITFN